MVSQTETEIALTKHDYINPQDVKAGDKIEFEFIARYDGDVPSATSILINNLDPCDSTGSKPNL